ncbi:bestrophin family ion channel [Escherichia coli]
MIVCPQHWLRRIFVWHGSVLSKISSRLLLNFLFLSLLFSCCPGTRIWALNSPSHRSAFSVSPSPFFLLRKYAGYARYVEARKLWGAVDDCLAVVTARGNNDIAGFGKCKGVCPAANCLRSLFTHDITQTATGGSAGSLSQRRRSSACTGFELSS